MKLNEYFSDAGLTEKIELELKKGFLEMPFLRVCSKDPSLCFCILLISEERDNSSLFYFAGQVFSGAGIS